MNATQNLQEVFGPQMAWERESSPEPTHRRTSSVENLEKKMGLATTCNEVLTAVDDLCKALPASQLPALVTKVGSILCVFIYRALISPSET